MGDCADTQNALAGLRKWQLVRDDERDPNGRVYIHPGTGEVYHSVTRVLGATAPEHQKEALARWLERPNSPQDRDMAATRGTLAHNHAEFVLKLASKLARSTTNKRGAWRTGKDGLERGPSSVTKWALQQAIQQAPRVGWSAAGFARGLRAWIEENVTAIHAVEFSGYHPCGAAGTCDALVDVAGTLTLVDWKSSANQKISEEYGDARIENYISQLGAYSLCLTHLTGIQVDQGGIVIARRSGAAEVRMLNKWELRGAEQDFLHRCDRYFTALAAGTPFMAP